jgi:predicted dehydrogenase
MVTSGLPAVRVLVAGAGVFGREHLDRLAARRDVRIVGVADPSPAALAHAAQRYGIAQCAETPRAIIDRIAADTLIVASPSATHVEVAMLAIARGLGVLVEKPVAPNAALAAQIAEAAKRKDAFVLPGHVLRFSKDHQRLVDIVRSGQIGMLRYVNSRRYRDDTHAARYRDVDPVLMTMIHDIDLALWIAGSPFRTVRARRTGDDPFRSLTVANATTESGVICDLRTTWTFSGEALPLDRVEAVGDRGSVELEVGRPLRLYADGRMTEIPLVPGDDMLANEHDHFLDCLRERKAKPALTLDDALNGLKLADAILESLRLEREVSV